MNGIINRLPSDMLPESKSGIPFVVKIPKGTALAWDTKGNLTYIWDLPITPQSVMTLNIANYPSTSKTRLLTGKTNLGYTQSVGMGTVSISGQTVNIFVNTSFKKVTQLILTEDTYYLAYA